MTQTNEVAIRLRNVSKTYHIKDRKDNTLREKVFGFLGSNASRQIKALQNVNLEVYRGEMLGVIGRNGSGKSTLISLLSGAMRPDRGGEIQLNGKTIRLSLGLGFDNELTARENIYVNGSIMGLSFKQIGSKFREIIEFSELQDFVDTRIKYFSSGMRSRLAFSIAIHTKAEIRLMDEFFGGVGDENFRKKSEEVFRKSFLEGRTIVHVSHSLNTIRDFCNRVMVLHKGECIALGSPAEAIEVYKSVLSTP